MFGDVEDGTSVANVLSVYRDGGLYCQADLTGATLRIGRASENDVILEDGLKRVSRTHAELRIEPNRVILSDLGSANGTLVNGVAIQSIELPSGTPFEIGPYRLLWEVAGASVSQGPETGVTASVAGKSKSGAVYLEPPSSPPPGSQNDTTKSGNGLAAVLEGVRRHPAAAAVSVVVLIGLAAGAFFVNRAHRRSVAVRGHLEHALDLLNAGDLDSAAAEADLVLTLDERNQSASDLKAKVTTLKDEAARAAAAKLAADAVPANKVEPPPPPPPPPPPVEPPKVEAEKPPSAGDGGSKAGKKGSKGKGTEKPAPDYPLLAAKPGESKTQLNERSRRAHERFVEATNLEAAGRLREAAQGLEGLLAQEPAYPGAERELQAIRTRLADRARRLFEDAKAMEGRQDWNGALQRYEEVRALDPSLPELDKRIADVRVSRQKDCQTQTTNATMFFNYRRWDDARPAVRKALASCDEGSQEYRTAKEVADKLPQ